MERTLVLIKPDAVQRGLVGKVMSYFESKGLTLAGNKMMHLDDDMLNEHYAHLVDKPFFKGIADFMKTTPVIVQCWEGKEVVEVVRKLCGVHASDSLETAQVEVPRFFKEEELFSYDKKNYEYIYAPDEK